MLYARVSTKDKGQDMENQLVALIGFSQQRFLVPVFPVGERCRSTWYSHRPRKSLFLPDLVCADGRLAIFGHAIIQKKGLRSSAESSTASTTLKAAVFTVMRNVQTYHRVDRTE